MYSKRVRGVLLSCVFGAAAYYACTVGAPFLSAFVPLAAALASGAFGGVFGSVLSVVFFSVPCFTAGTVGLLPFAAAMLVSGLFLQVVIRASNRAFHLLGGCCLAALLGIWARVLTAYIQLGDAGVTQFFSAGAPALAAAGELLAAAGAGTASSLMAEAALIYTEMVPGLAMLTAMAAGLFGYAMCSYFAADRLRCKTPEFRNWHMPKGHFYGSLLMFAVAYIGEAAGWPGFESVSFAVDLVVLGIYSVQGLAVLWFFLKRTRLAGVFRVAVCALLSVFFTMGLCCLFAFDEVLNIRRRVA